MNYPFVSIITPSLNQAEFIKETLESVFTQDYPNIEYIVMDGGSMDGTIDIIRNFELQTKRFNKNMKFCWTSRKDRGQADAINKGIKMAHGDILCYLNSDDVLSPHAISSVVDAFYRNPKVLWITGDYDVINEKGKKVQSFVTWYKRVLRCLPLGVSLSFSNPVIQPSTFWRKSLSRKIGTFNQRLRYTFDYDYWLRAVVIGKPIILPQKLSLFRVHESSKGGKYFNKQFEEEIRVADTYHKNWLISLLHKTHAYCITVIYKTVLHRKTV